MDTRVDERVVHSNLGAQKALHRLELEYGLSLQCEGELLELLLGSPLLALLNYCLALAPLDLARSFLCQFIPLDLLHGLICFLAPVLLLLQLLSRLPLPTTTSRRAECLQCMGSSKGDTRG